MTKDNTTRRQFLKGAGAAAAAAGALPLLRTGKAEAARREVNLFCWDGYVDPKLLDGFTEEHGVGVKYELLISDPDAINRLRAGETKIWDIINLNQYWAPKIMWPEKLIRPMDKERFAGYFTEDKVYQVSGNVEKNIYSEDREHLIGIVQRADCFDFGVNTDVISWETGNNLGWNMFLDPAMKGRYGILAYDNWNIFHLLMTAGIDPFRKHTDDEIDKFGEICRQIVNGAKMITDDFVQINLGMLNGEIDAGFSSGTYSLSGARLDGQWNLVHVMPKDGPARGMGGINWIEVTSLVNNPDVNPAAEDFLEYCLQPEVSHVVAIAGGVLNPVLQMKQPSVYDMFSDDELRAIAYYPEHDDYGHMGYTYRLAHAVQFEQNPDYDAMWEIYSDARRTKES
jgi:spermidine/putrescine transport system substrate-binding protein